MPTRPLSHEQRHKHGAQTTAQRKARDADYGARRRTKHGPDPRSTARWQRIRLVVLRREPLCADPYKLHALLPVPATEVDHIQGIWDAPDLAFDESNMQGLCRACHARKGGEERRARHVSKN